ncbi:uncharacterized protein LOC130754675 [Actinidia eriantha]|uniref:uncharacterized protein LOC130754675 n=1 Tax=Actinidia eriantha TaxID=165200 RepID=UPI0025869F95|nr:uncharacterized protein LOC130754675 [Actinidia eriantha]
MADFEPPSFSLGLDFDLDSQPQTAARNDPQARPSSTHPSFRLIEDDDDFEIPTMGRVPRVSEPPRTLKRIRRGLASESAPVAQKRKSAELFCNVEDEEIEEFSSQEDRFRENEDSSARYHSGCSSSKFSLHGHGVFTKQSASQCEATKRKHASNIPASANLETSSNKLMFRKLTVSPLRRFKLIDSDSDSDDPSISEGGYTEANKVHSSLKKQYKSGPCPSTSEQKRTKVSASTSQTEDLWKGFYTEKSCPTPTPALDEFCEEYFRSAKDKNEARNLKHDKRRSGYEGSYDNYNVINNDEHLCKLGDPIPPAHRYFFHEDPRIQNLVRSRLSYFFPLVAMNNRGNMHSGSSVIDYMSQFSHGEGSKKPAAGKTNAGTSSTRGKKNLKKSNAEAVSQGSEGWVNPKSNAGIPKDAGKRRVHAVGQSAGHWYTGPNEKRVYITSGGQELTGRIAYRHYKKESGAGFKKSKKKTASKKLTAANKKPAAKKKKPAVKKK